MLTPCLAFDGNPEEAATTWSAIFPDSALGGIVRAAEGMPFPAGTAITVQLTLAGQRFTLLNAGPRFVRNGSISFFFFAADPAEARRTFDALAEGGTVHMPFAEWPWSPAYGWVEDRFGVHWQVMPGTGPRIVPCLMFTGERHRQAEVALRRYGEIFGGELQGLARFTAEEGPEGAIKHGRLALPRGALIAADSHLQHPMPFTEGTSLVVECPDQASLDRTWQALTADGGQESRCGWLRDRFGVWWQVLPDRLGAWLTGPRAREVVAALLLMDKLDIAVLAAAAGE